MQGIPVWPQSVAGWLAMFASILALLGIAVSHGRQVQTINGLGSRVGKMEKGDERRDTKVIELDGQVRRILDQHEMLIKLLGETRGESVRAHEDYEAMAEQLAVKIDTLRAEMNVQHVGVRERLAGVEAQLKQMQR